MGITEDEYWPADDFLTQQGYANPILGGTSGVVGLRSDQAYGIKVRPSKIVDFFKES